jgi:hypothetical protein
MENFMNRLKKEIDRGVTIVGAKSKELLETTKIKNRIGDLNNQKQQALIEIGGITYQMFRNPDYDGGTAIQDKCSFVAGLEEEIRLKEDELEKIRQATDASINKTEGTARYWDVKPEDAQVGPIIDVTPTSVENKTENPSPAVESAIIESIAERPPEINPVPETGATGQPENSSPDETPSGSVDSTASKSGATDSETADSGATPSPAGSRKKLCETCSSIIDENSKFCSNCGSKLK